MKTGFCVFAFLLIFLAPIPAAAAGKVEALDADKDGKTDSWLQYDKEGSLKATAKDTNQDGKPDTYTQWLQGRNLVMRESDGNFDGRIDRRWLMQWDPNKRMITGMTRQNLPQYTAMPGYVTLWSEEDNDFDGKIDAYTERGNKNPSRERIGQPIEKSAK